MVDVLEVNAEFDGFSVKFGLNDRTPVPYCIGACLIPVANASVTVFLQYLRL